MVTKLSVGRCLISLAAVAMAGLLYFAAGAGTAEAQTARLAWNHPPDVSSLVPNAVSSSRQLNLRIAFVLRNRAELNKLLREQQDPSSPQYHQWLTSDEFAAKFGPAPADERAVERWLTSAGFKVVGRSATILQVQGTVAQAASLFAVSFVGSADGRLYANEQDPAVPGQFASIISSIGGLDNLMHAKHSGSWTPAPASKAISPASAAGAMILAENVPDAESRPGQQPTGAQPETSYQGIVGFAPSDLYTFYDENSLLNNGTDGSDGGGCIAVIEDSNFSTSAVNLFDSTFSLSAVTLTKILADGTDPGYTADESEALLDVEWGHAAAPGASITAYIGDGSTLGAQALVDALKAAVTDNKCASIDMSFSFCGASSSFFEETLGGLFAQAAAQGQSVFVASGDDGAAGLVYSSSQNACTTATSRHVSEASADPDVTAIGGTEFSPVYDGSGDDVGNVPEDAWNESALQNGKTTPLGASGGGASAIFTKPAWQAGQGVPNDGKRDVPDIAIASGILGPGFFLGDDPTQSGGSTIDCCWGGTSVGAALWSGIAQLLDQADIQNGGNGRLGNVAPRLYVMGEQMNVGTTGLRDVTLGNNSFNGVTGFNAGPGYDQTTGWGTPDIGIFVPAFVTGQFVASAGDLSYGPKVRHFPTQLFSSVGSASRQFPIVVINRNSLNLPAELTSVSVTGQNNADFSVANNGCSPAIGAKSKCLIELLFKPTGIGLRQATLTVSGHFQNSPLQVPLFGNAVAPILRYGPKGLGFGKVSVGTMSPAKTVTLINRTTVPIDISSIVSSSNDFSENNTCGGSIAAQGGTCTLSVTFKPSATGLETATLTITDDARGGTHLVRLTGRGM